MRLNLKRHYSSNEPDVQIEIHGTLRMKGVSLFVGDTKIAEMDEDCVWQVYCEMETIEAVEIDFETAKDTQHAGRYVIVRNTLPALSTSPYSIEVVDNWGMSAEEIWRDIFNEEQDMADIPELSQAIEIAADLTKSHWRPAEIRDAAGRSMAIFLHGERIEWVF